MRISTVQARTRWSGTSFSVTGARHGTFFFPRGTRGTFDTLLKRWQARVKMRGVFRRQFFVATFWKGRKSFCETVVICDLGHDDDSVWQVQHFGCLGLIFRGRSSTL